ncbi:MAG: glycine--tRNA ligase subunit beta [Desulfobacteraceae bacterium]
MGVELLLEIGTEEIPSGYIEDGLSELKRLARARLGEARVEVGGGLETFGSPRRLVLVGRGLGEKQEDAVEEITGPPVKAAYDRDGNPTKAALGFAEKQGVPVESLGRIETSKGPYVFVRREIPGRPSIEVLAELLPGVIRDIPWPKSMRWGSLGFSFARPIHWIVAMLGGEVIPFELAGIRSGDRSRGHRFMSPGAFKVSGVDDYFEKVTGAYVLVDPEKRKEEVRKAAVRAAGGVSGEPVLEEGLVSTVAHLVEFPTAVCGGFDREFLGLPAPVLITTMAEHQRYFAVKDAHGGLMPHFVAVNNTLAGDESVVRRGHERVLRARLEDADFFFKEDRKRPLEARVDDLRSVIYQAKLGTSYQKVERFTRLAEYMAGQTAPERVKETRKAAWLAKCDLVTEMVKEFPSLQGVMGEVYARLDEHPEPVCRAVREHYMPVRAGDDLPDGLLGALVGVADRMDTIAGCFAIGEEPSGAADPFALRRHALAVMRILEHRAWDLSLRGLAGEALEALEGTVDFDYQAVLERLMDFLKERFRNRMLQEGYGYDVVEAVLSVRFDLIPRLRPAMDALSRFKDSSSEFHSLVLAFKRATNILKKQDRQCEVAPDTLEDRCEADLWAAYKQASGEVVRLVEQGRDYEALERLAALRAPVDAFFDGVEVLTQEERARENRVGIVQRVSGLFLKVADFSQFSLP